MNALAIRHQGVRVGVAGAHGAPPAARPTRGPASESDESGCRIASDIHRTPANLCPFCRYVVNEIRRLADDSLSHDERPNTRPIPKGRHCWFKHADGILSMTNSNEKRMWAISNRFEAFALETLAGLLTDIEPLQVDEATLN